MVKNQTLLEFERAVRRFRPNDIKDCVLPELPEITWAEVKNVILKENILMNTKSLAKILARAVSKLQETEIKKRIGILGLIDASLYSSRRTWTCFQMYRQRETTNVSESNPEQIGNSVARACRLAGLEVIQHVLCHDTLHWISVINKKIVKGKSLVFQRPRIFAYSLGDQYLFAAQKDTSKALLMAVANALHYDSIIYAKLEGCHVPDMLKILMKKDGRGRGGLQSKPFEPAERKKDGDNIVILPNKSRRRYAESVFGKNPPKLGKITLNAPDCPWKSSLMEGETIDMKVVFAAPNVYEYFTDLAELGILATPFPSSIENVMYSGKSTITMRPIHKAGK